MTNENVPNFGRVQNKKFVFFHQILLQKGARLALRMFKTRKGRMKYSGRITLDKSNKKVISRLYFNFLKTGNNFFSPKPTINNKFASARK